MFEGNFPFSRVCPSVPVVILMIKVIILLLPSIRLFKSADKTISRPYWRQVCVSVGGPVDILLRSDPSADLWPDVSSLHSLSPGQQRVFPCLFSTIPHELLMHMHTRTNPTRPTPTSPSRPVFPIWQLHASTAFFVFLHVPEMCRPRLSDLIIDFVCIQGKLALNLNPLDHSRQKKKKSVLESTRETIQSEVVKKEEKNRSFVVRFE